MMSLLSSTTLLRSLAALLLLGAATVHSEKDSDYYYPGISNPNTKEKMYWKDSINVLQDLDQFEALYIKYHGCVWTKYGTRYGSGQNYDEQGQDEDDADDENDNGCGGWGGEYFWYMGRTQCFKANAAYSLYGVLKGESEGSNPCKKKTYINSFFTTFGVESFAGPLGLGIDYANSQCTAQEPEEGQGGGGNEDYYEYAAADDDYLDDNFEFHSKFRNGSRFVLLWMIQINVCVLTFNLLVSTVNRLRGVHVLRNWMLSLGNLCDRYVPRRLLPRSQLYRDH